MFSRCPQCQNQQAVTVEQLRGSRGLLVCAACGKRFDALPTLSERADDDLRQPDEADGDLFADTSVQPAKVGSWRLGSVVALSVLVGQLVYFEGERIGRQPLVAAVGQQFCSAWGCRQPVYKNPDAWALSHGDLQVQPDKTYRFSAALTNQSAFSQACPDLKLVLLDFNGRAVAERVFSAGQYLSGIHVLTANETAQVSLLIAPIAEKIGGYSFALL